MKILQMVFCVLACLCVAAVIPAGVFLEWYCLIFAVAAVIFAVAMVLCRHAKPTNAPPLSPPDFDEHAKKEETAEQKEESSSEE